MGFRPTGPGGARRVSIPVILGLQRTGNTLEINPCIPKGWKAYELTYRYGNTSYHILVKNPDGVNRGVKQVMLDGWVLPEGKIRLLDDGQEHKVRVRMRE